MDLRRRRKKVGATDDDVTEPVGIKRPRLVHGQHDVRGRGTRHDVWSERRSGHEVVDRAPVGAVLGLHVAEKQVPLGVGSGEYRGDAQAAIGHVERGDGSVPVALHAHERARVLPPGHEITRVEGLAVAPFHIGGNRVDHGFGLERRQLGRRDWPAHAREHAGGVRLEGRGADEVQDAVRSGRGARV